MAKINKIENNAAPSDIFAVCVDPMNSKRNNFYVLYPFDFMVVGLFSLVRTRQVRKELINIPLRSKFSQEFNLAT